MKFFSTLLLLVTVVLVAGSAMAEEVSVAIVAERWEWQQDGGVISKDEITTLSTPDGPIRFRPNIPGGLLKRGKAKAFLAIASGQKSILREAEKDFRDANAVSPLAIQDQKILVAITYKLHGRKAAMELAKEFNLQEIPQGIVWRKSPR